MDPVQGSAVSELLGIIRRAKGEGEDACEDDGAGNLIESLPRTNPDFEACRLRSMLCDQLEAHLGTAVDEALASDELKVSFSGGVREKAIDEAVARLTASPCFVGVVENARATVQQAAGVQKVAASGANGTTTAAAAAGISSTPIPNAATGNFLRRNMDALSSSDTEGEDTKHVKKKAARRDDWVGIFDLGGGFGAGGGGFSPRVDIEGALGQLEAGLESPGPGSATSAVEALGLLAEADPELFQFGNHWPLFLKLARRALDSADPAVHAKGMTLHWVMYEKAMGMCAADMCEGVLAHARRSFSTTVHVLSAPSTHLSTTAAAGKGCGNGDAAAANLMVIGDSKLACAAREARALHGMLMTIHETFQHLPEKRVWSIVSSFLFLFGDAIASLEEVHDNRTTSEQVSDDSAAGSGVRCNGSGSGSGDDCGAVPLVGRSSPSSGGGDSPPTVLLPAHFLAVAGKVDEWLPGWLRSLPTGRLVRAVNDAGLMEEMARRCTLLGRIPFHGLSRGSNPVDSAAAAAAAAATTAIGTDATNFSGVPASAPLEACLPKAAIVRHRLSLCAGSSAGTLCSLGSAAPLGRALWLSAAELERSLLLQSISFLGIIATHCRGILRPCPPPPSDDDEGSEVRVLPAGRRAESDPGEGGVDRGLDQGTEVVQALVQCARRRETCRARRDGMKMSRTARRQQSLVKGEGSRSVRFVALGYIEKLAKATAGGESTPFTSVVIDCLFSPLGDPQFNGWRQGSSEGERVGGGRSDDGCSRETGGLLVDEPPTFLRALAEIAGVLLSSRGNSAGFFVDGPDGPRASRALLELVRCAAELARRACCQGGLAGEKTGSGMLPVRHADSPECRFSSWGEPGDYSKRLAVEFACALAPIVFTPPKQRAAGWAALWQVGVPRALARLVEHLDHHGTDKVAFGIENQYETLGGSGGSGSGGGLAGSNHDTAKQNGELHDRLLLSLVEWARDLAGVDCLRRVGLAGRCGSFLSRELGRRHLDRSTRDECADPRPLALAMRLALCSEGLGELLSADGGVVTGVNAGLNLLGELLTLPELLQSHMVDLPPPHALAVRSNSGHDGGFDGYAGRVRGGRSTGLELCGDAGDLRCLDFISRMSLSGAFSLGSDLTDRDTVQVKQWLRWGLARALSPLAESSFDAGEAATDEVGSYVSEDVRVAALHLVTNLASDLAIAVAIEAEWSLSELLARRKAGGDEPVGNACMTGDAGVGGEAAGKAAPKGGVGSRLLLRRDEGASKFDVGSIVCVPDIVEPAALSLARLAVSLTCLGGPNEERHKLLRKLREAEAQAPALAVDATVASGILNVAAAAGVQRSASGVHGVSLVEGVEFPDDRASDEEWWMAAGRCVLEVVERLSDPRGARSAEAFELLRKAAARRSFLWPEEEEATACSAAERVAMYNARCPLGNVDKRVSCALEGDWPERRNAVMNKLCFSYARSLGFVDDDDDDGNNGGGQDRFEVGLKDTLAASAAGMTANSTQESPDCDWFAAVAFIASGMDSKAASEMLQDLHRHIPRALFVLPLAGKRYAELVVELDNAGRAPVPGESTPPPATSVNTLPLPGVNADETTGIYHGTRVLRSLVAADGGSSGGPAARNSCRDPPLLMLAALVEEVLEEELPLMSAALRSAGWAAAPLAARWMRQCMLCVVDWPGVVAYLALALLRGHDYQVYFVVALFRTAQPRVMEAASRGLDLMPLLGRGDALEGFHLEEALSFMKGLERRHRPRCLASTSRYLARQGRDVGREGGR